MSLLQKYNVPGPRYTSYPTVPYWQQNTFSLEKWKQSCKASFKGSNSTQGISLYIHLPFCENLCTFCGCHKRITKHHHMELPYIEALLKEWQLYKELFHDTVRIKEIHLGGGTPTFFSPAHLQQLIEGILKDTVVTDQHEFSFEGHPCNTTRLHLQTLFDLGFRRVSFGVQDYSAQIQKAINRHQSFHEVAKVTLWAKEIGYTSISHDLIYGLPFQTINNIIDTIEKTNSLSPDRLAFYSYAHVPWIKGNGQRGFSEQDLPVDYIKRNMYEKGKELLACNKYIEIGMDHFALKTDSLFHAYTHGTIHRNFMGYTNNKTQLMIGLGVSSISDSWYGFAQNEKNITQYYNLLKENLIPVVKGHILDQEDLLIRGHILDLMCHFKTSWDLNNTVIDYQKIIQELEELQQDDLITIDKNNLVITKKGRPFIRNICMVFDLRLKRNKPDRQLFSMTI